MTDRGQSEALGYVLVFSLVMLTVGTVYVGGFSAVQDTRGDAQLHNMGRAFEVFSDNLRDNYRDGAPRRATEIKLGEGRLSYRNESPIRIRAVEVGNASNNVTFPGAQEWVHHLVYRSGETEIAYAGGAVVRSDDGRAGLLSRPEWVVGDDQAVVPLVLTTAASPRRSLSGPNTVLVRSVVQSRGVGVFDPPGDNATRVNVTVRGPYAEAWADYFEEEEGYAAVDADAADGAVTYQFTTRRLVVVRTSVELALQP